MAAVFHAWQYGRFIEIQSNLRRKKLHKMNQDSNFPGGSFSNRENVRASIQFRRESQPEHLKRWIFLKNRPIHFCINSASVVIPVKRNQLSFSSIEINKPLSAPVQCVVDQIQVQKPILVVTQIKCLITFRVESSIRPGLKIHQFAITWPDLQETCWSKHVHSWKKNFLVTIINKD